MTDPVVEAPVTVTPPTVEPVVTPVVTPEAPAGNVLVADPPVTPTEGWGDDWRQKYAGEDEKLLKRLERYASPKAAIDALLEAQTKISKGEFSKPLPADATDEQKSAWREANGIPSKPDEYLSKLPDGMVLGEEDKAIFGKVAEELHALNAPPAIFNSLAKWYEGFKDSEMTRLAEVEQASLQETQEALREEWGGDYKANVNLINGWLAAAPEGVKDSLLSARLPDGTPVVNQVPLMRWLAQQAREINPAATLVPSGNNTAMGVEQEIASIEKTMRENRRAYNADTAMQARYLKLIEAREKILAKAS